MNSPGGPGETMRTLVALGFLGFSLPAAAATCDAMPGTVYFDGACRDAAFFEGVDGSASVGLQVQGPKDAGSDRQVVVLVLGPRGTTVLTLTDGAAPASAPTWNGYRLLAREQQVLKVRPSDGAFVRIHRVGGLAGGSWSAVETRSTWLDEDTVQECSGGTCAVSTVPGGGTAASLADTVKEGTADAANTQIDAALDGQDVALIGPGADHVESEAGGVVASEFGMILGWLLLESVIACDELEVDFTETMSGSYMDFGGSEICWEQDVTVTYKTHADCTTTVESVSYGSSIVYPCPS